MKLGIEQNGICWGKGKGGVGGEASGDLGREGGGGRGRQVSSTVAMAVGGEVTAAGALGTRGWRRAGGGGGGGESGECGLRHGGGSVRR